MISSFYIQYFDLLGPYYTEGTAPLRVSYFLVIVRNSFANTPFICKSIKSSHFPIISFVKLPGALTL